MNRCGSKQQFRFDLGSIPSSAIGVDLIIFFYLFAQSFIKHHNFLLNIYLILDFFAFFFYVFLSVKGISMTQLSAVLTRTDYGG